MEVKQSGEVNEAIKSVIEDPFKGLAETTCCLAGDDVFFLQSRGFFFLRKYYKRGRRSFPEHVLLFMELVTKIPDKLKKLWKRQ